MGMFDTFSDHQYEIQMKCFYHLFSSGGQVMHSGGVDAEFTIGMPLPMESDCYHFEKDCVFLTDDEECPYILVQNNIFVAFLKNKEEIPEDIAHFYTRFGDHLKIKNTQELKEFENTSFRSPLYEDWFFKESFEKKLSEHISALIQHEKRLGMYKEPSVVKEMMEKESRLLREALDRFKQEDENKYEQYVKDNNLRLKFLFL